ncbi:putative transposase, partial [Citreicella sp. 357]
ALRASKRLGRKIWRKWSGYHRRSRAETEMHCMKLLGQRLMVWRGGPTAKSPRFRFVSPS